jgi:hypothetical protein
MNTAAYRLTTAIRTQLQQQPMRLRNWRQQQMGSTDFQPIDMLDRCYGEDSEPDKDGHPRAQMGGRAVRSLPRRALSGAPC